MITVELAPSEAMYIVDLLSQRVESFKQLQNDDIAKVIIIIESKIIDKINNELRRSYETPVR